LRRIASGDGEAALDGVVPVRPFAMRRVRLMSAVPARSRTPILVRGVALGAAFVGAVFRRRGAAVVAPIGARCHGGTAEKRGQKPITAAVAVPSCEQVAR
jgi:hypothetical protein